MGSFRPHITFRKYHFCAKLNGVYKRIIKGHIRQIYTLQLIDVEVSQLNIDNDTILIFFLLTVHFLNLSGGEKFLTQLKWIKTQLREKKRFSE